MLRFLEGEWHFLLTGLRQIITALVWYPFSFHFKDKFRGLKTAPEDSLAFFLAVCVCIVYHSYGGENICAEHVHRLFFEMATTLSLPSPFLLIVEIQNQSVHDVQSQQRNRSAGANENLKQKHVNCLKRGKRGCSSCDSLWFSIWLIEKIARVFWTNHNTKKNRTEAIPDFFGHSIEHRSKLPRKSLSKHL